LGVEESYNKVYENEKEKLKMEHVRRLRLTLNTQVSAGNKVPAVRTFAIHY
jgi:hypothetical protein